MKEDEERIKYGVLTKERAWYPFHMNLLEKFEWFMNLKDGKNIILSAVSRGKSLQGMENANRSHQQLGNFNRDGPNRRIIPNPDTGLTKNESDEIKRRRTKVLECLEVLLNPTRKIPSGINESWRFAFCSECDRIVFGKATSLKHHCGAKKMTVAYKNFPDLARLIYPHDLLREPHLSACIDNFDSTSKKQFTVCGEESDITVVPLLAREVLLPKS